MVLGSIDAGNGVVDEIADFLRCSVPPDDSTLPESPESSKSMPNIDTSISPDAGIEVSLEGVLDQFRCITPPPPETIKVEIIKGEAGFWGGWRHRIATLSCVWILLLALVVAGVTTGLVANQKRSGDGGGAAAASLQASEPPTSHPTNRPTLSPSIPPTTALPSASPTIFSWRTEPEPLVPDPSYFNYDPNSAYGPDDWKDLDGNDTREKGYWDKYMEWIKPDMGDNECGKVSGRQSPINLEFDRATGECLEYHEIRAKEGKYYIEDTSKVELLILGSKLRITSYWVSELATKDNTDAIPGPSADIPKGWGDQLPVLFVDLKVPSEHTVEGKRYAAEYQIFLIQNRKAQRGAPVVSVLLDIHPEDKANESLQVILDKFQSVWDDDMRQCEERKRWARNRGLKHSPIGLDKKGVVRDGLMAGPFNHRRLEHEYTKWNPWHHDIVRSVWFFAYEGSLTEPPCTEFVEWRIIDVPAFISKGQLRQIEKLLFAHVDGYCQKTSNHYNGSVARPLQPLNGRQIHRCMCQDFISDEDRVWYGRNECWTDDQAIFHDQVEGHWVTRAVNTASKKKDGFWNCYGDTSEDPPCCGTGEPPPGYSQC